jgi:hypothetical protein
MIENFLSFLAIVQFALENMHKIDSVDEISSHFQSAIEDITNEWHEQVEQISPWTHATTTNLSMGQEDFCFKFREGEKSFGNIMLDFLPDDPNKYLKGQLQAFAKKTETPPSYNKRLANFKIQIFFDGIFAKIQLKNKYNVIYSFITRQYGPPNKTPKAIEISNNLKETSGLRMDCWHFEKNNINYAITLYFFKGKNGLRPYVSFSVAEVFKQ